MINSYKTRYNPFIFQSKTFLINKIVCSSCQNITYNYEDTPILKIPVNNTLAECFEDLVSDEEVEYNCYVCKCDKKKAIKSCKIWKNPMVLFIHLNRFKSLPNGRLLKNNTNIDIPHTFDIAPYYDKSMKTDLEMSTIYKLKGISNHHGGINGGHYTADCCCIVDNKSWYNFDDSRVSKYSDDNIDTSSAYILMYEMEM